jgi:predicted O-linked N-acetylglucosamine transferase (SPINDLY family)
VQEAEAKNKFEIAQKSFDNKSYKEAQKIWSEIINYYPNNLSDLRNLSLAFYYDNNLEQAEIILKKIILVNKKEPNALTMLILILEDQDKIDEAKKYIDIGLNEKLLDNHWEIKKKLILPTIFKDLKDIDDSRERLEKDIDIILKSDEITSLDIDTQLIKPVQFDLSYNQYDNLEINKKCISFYRKIYPQLNKANSLKKVSNSKINIGFISEYLTDHTIGKLFKGIILNLDKNKFEVKVFHTTKTKKGKIYQELIDSEKTGQIKNYILPAKFNEKQKVIYNEGLDILFYPEIGLSLELYYLSFIKLASYQITSWGHPETTGNATMNYFLTSKLIENFGSEKNFSENLLYADYLPMYYYTPVVNNVLKKNELSKNNIYSCPQTLFKIHPDFDLILGKILQEDKKAKLYFIKDLNKTYYKKLLHRFKKNKKIDLDRIKFIEGISWENYINHCGQASVLLDPLYFGAGNSFYESMFYGTPTVSKPTKYTKSRLVLGAYNQMKIEGAPIVENIDDYVGKAIEIANDKNLYELKKNYSEKAKNSLYENKKIVPNLEKIFTKIVD